MDIRPFQRNLRVFFTHPNSATRQMVTSSIDKVCHFMIRRKWISLQNKTAFNVGMTLRRFHKSTAAFTIFLAITAIYGITKYAIKPLYNRVVSDNSSK